jgi:hypothetical protein
MSGWIFGVVLAVAIAAVWWLMSQWGRHMWGKAYDKPIKMGEMMQRMGVAPEALVATGGMGRAVAAARRCGECANEDVCRAWLDGKDSRPAKTFCPNAGLFESLKP